MVKENKKTSANAKEKSAIPPDKFAFSSPEGAKIAGSILSRQLERFEGVKTKAKAKGKEVELQISSPDAAGVKASQYTAARLAKIMQGLDEN